MEAFEYEMNVFLERNLLFGIFVSIRQFITLDDILYQHACISLPFFASPAASEKLSHIFKNSRILNFSVQTFLAYNSFWKLCNERGR